MNVDLHKKPRSYLPLLAAALLLLGPAACGGRSEGSREQQRATEEALAATEAADTAAVADTADTTNMWRRADTAGTTADTAASAPAGEVTYDTYRNDELGFSVRYPSSILRPAEEIGNGNGRSFEAPDGSASMLVYATRGATAEKLQRRFEEQTTNADLNVTYQTKGDDWYVLSGYRGDHIFYERAEARGGALRLVRMFYDRSQKKAFDPIVREVSFSLGG